MIPVQWARTLLKYRVEAMLFVHSLAYNSASLGVNSLLLQKVCFPEGPPGTNVVCKNTEHLKEFSSISTARTTLRECLPGLIVLFAGSWRDYTGLSLPLVILSHAGESIAMLMVLFSSIMWDFSTWATAVVESGLPGLVGARQMVNVASISYISEHTPREERAVRVSIVMVSQMTGSCLATAASGYILSWLEYPWFFAITLTMYLLNIVLACSSFKDGPRRDLNSQSGPFESVKCLKRVFRPRENQVVIWVMIVISCLVTGCLSSEWSVSYAFFQRVLHFTPESVGILTSYRQLFNIAGGILTPVLVKGLKFSEFFILMLCTISSSMSCFGMSFITRTFEAYICYAFDMMRIVILSVSWAIITRCINKSEFGVFQSFLAFGEALTPFALNPLYLYIFTNTIDTFPGAFYIGSGSLLIFCAIAIWISKYFYKNLEKLKILDRDTEEDTKEKCPEEQS